MIDLGGWEPPEGWTVETLGGYPNCIVIGCSESGYVTVNMQYRYFGLGISNPCIWQHQNGMKNFTGKGWKKRLFDNAEYFLRDATK